MTNENGSFGHYPSVLTIAFAQIHIIQEWARSKSNVGCDGISSQASVCMGQVDWSFRLNMLIEFVTKLCYVSLDTWLKSMNGAQSKEILIHADPSMVDLMVLGPERNFRYS